MSDNETRKRIRASSEPRPGPWDAIVIGSGLSGLTTAAGLAVRGKRVLVLERHFQAGGFTHVFRRGEFEWDVGIHYLGNGEPFTHRGSDWFMQLAALTGGRITFNPIGAPVDRIRFPGLAVDMPSLFEIGRAHV